MAIAIQDPDGVVLFEVFPLQHRAWTDILDGTDEGLDEVVVFRPSQPRLAVTDVHRVRQKLLVVRAHVERHRQGVGRVYARAGGVEGQLPDRDAHSTGALIAQAQDPFVVGRHDQPDIVDGVPGARRLWPRIAEKVGDAFDIGRRDPQAAWSTHDVAEGLTRSTDRGRVDDRHELLEVLEDDPIEQCLVAILQRRQADVALEVVALAADVLELEADLLLDLRRPRREQAAQTEDITFAVVEPRVLVQQGSLEKVGAPERYVLDAGRAETLDRARKLSHWVSIDPAYGRCNSRSAYKRWPGQGAPTPR